MRGIPPAIPCHHFYSILTLSLGLLLGACSSVPVAPSTTAPAAARGTAPANPTATRAPAMPAAGSGRGGYYQDDGPGDNPPANLLAVPDAEPKLEPLYPGASKPYVVFGKTYTPIGLEAPLKQRGTGSWYGKKFHGQKTSSGERYDMYKMTAAHPTMPLPSYARVTNLSNGKQVIVRVNDRGPFHSSRIIDLSYTAALKLGYLGKGSTDLEVERLLPAEIARMERDRLGERAVALNEPAAASLPATKTAATVVRSSSSLPVTTGDAALATSALLGFAAQSSAAVAPIRVAQSASGTAQPARAVAQRDTQSSATTSMAPAIAASVEPAVPEQATLPQAGSKLVLVDAESPSASSAPAASPVTAATVTMPQSAAASGAYYLQLGAFSQAANADAVRSRLQHDLADGLAPLEVVQNGAVFRLFSGPFPSRTDATLAAQKIQEAGQTRPFVVQR